MRNIKRKLLVDVFKSIDIIIIAISLFASFFFAHGRLGLDNLGEMLLMRISIKNFVILVVYLLFTHLIFNYFGLYNSRRLSTFLDDIKSLLISVSLCGAAAVVGSFLCKVKIANSQFLQYFFLTAFVLMSLSRFFLRWMLGKIRKKGRNLRNLVIVGTGKRALNHAKNILDRPELGYILSGFVDTQWHSDKPDISVNDTAPGIVSDFDSFSEYLRDNVVDEVLIAIPIKSCYEVVSDLIAACEEQGIIVRMCTDFFNLKIASSQIDYIGEDQILSIYTSSMFRKMYLIKEVFDIVCGAILLVMLLPVFILTALAIKLSSKGPIFFVQERMGINKRPFKLYKFRTMVPDAEAKIDDLEHLNETQGPAFKIKDDPRIIPIGKFLRKTSIDELPQLFNVIKGDISLVGPRPLPIRDYEGFEKDWHRRRFSVKPGITCTWQITGRSGITFDKWMKMDLEYIDNWSLLIDFKILLKTIPAALMGRGAC